MTERLTTLFYSCVSGILFIFSFPGYGHDYLIWFSLVPLFFVISKARNSKFKTGLLAGTVIYTGSIIWLVPTLSQYGGLPTISAFISILILGVYLGIYTGILAFMFPDTEKKPVFSLFFIPAAWTALDFIASLLFTGFPWVFPGYVLFEKTILVQLASLTGVYGLTYYIVFINAGIFILARNFFIAKEFRLKSAGKILCSCGAVTLLVFFYSYSEADKTEKLMQKASNAKILLMQANISPTEKQSSEAFFNTLEKFFTMSDKKLNIYDLAVWPETALPYPVFSSQEILGGLIYNAEKNGNQLVGLLHVKSINKDSYLMKNRASLFTQKGETHKFYDKIHLVPFGEYIPLKKYFPFLSRFIVPAGEFISGENNNTIDIGKMKIGTKICFEIIFPNLVRKQVAHGANIIINMTNDAWFGKTAAPYQHLAISALRAVENRRSVARCANTGISAHILPSGKIKKSIGLFQSGTINSDLPLIDETTLYTRFGDFFAYLCVIMLLSCGFFQYIEFRKNKNKGE